MIDQIARTSAEQLRTETMTDVEAGLADLHVRQERHHRRSRVAAVAAVVLAVGLGWSARAALTQGDEGGQRPIHRPAPTKSAFEYPCDVIRVDCLGNRTYEIALERPVRWQVPSGFHLNFGNGVTPLGVESYGTAGHADAGVMVREQVRASSPTGNRAASGVADDPHAFVDWVAGRPFLRAGPVVQTEIDGHRAWQVQVTMAPGAGLGLAQCNYDARCHPITYVPGTVAWGMFGDEAAELTAFRLPEAGTTVVWSWTFSGDTRDLADMDEVVGGLSWPVH
jgi:hypothetical protein